MKRDDVVLSGCFLFGLMLMIGCTLAEWGQVGSDGYQTASEAAPQAAAEAASGNLPGAIAIGVLAVLGVVYRSALRDFGGAAGSKVASVVRKIIGPILQIFGKKN